MYDFQWMMLQEGGAGWFGGLTEPVTVTVVDTQAPTITCPANVTAVAASQCPPALTKVVTFPAPTASDNCSGVSVVCSPASGSVFSVGNTTVTCTATDASNNSAQCSFVVSVFNACLQDDSSPGRVILFNTQTGDYVACCGLQKLSGRGRITQQGCVVTLDHSGFVRATVDFSVRRGNGSIQGSTTCALSDSNTANNTCGCSVP
jgi:HYR domain